MQTLVIHYSADSYAELAVGKYCFAKNRDRAMTMNFAGVHVLSETQPGNFWFWPARWRGHIFKSVRQDNRPHWRSSQMRSVGCRGFLEGFSSTDLTKEPTGPEM